MGKVGAVFDQAGRDVRNREVLQLIGKHDVGLRVSDHGGRRLKLLRHGGL